MQWDMRKNLIFLELWATKKVLNPRKKVYIPPIAVTKRVKSIFGHIRNAILQPSINTAYLKNSSQAMDHSLRQVPQEKFLDEEEQKKYFPKKQGFLLFSEKNYIKRYLGQAFL